MNVLFVVVDSVRYDFARSNRTQTPILDHFATEGIEFEQLISAAPWTLPSISSLISGIHPHKLGRFNWDDPFRDGYETMFTILSEEDYSVGSFVFDEKYLFSNYEPANVLGDTIDEQQPVRWLQNNANKEPFGLLVHYWWTHMPYEAKDSAEAWREGNRDIRSMVTTEEGRKKVRERYVRSIETMDDWLRDIKQALRTADALDDTIVIIIGDHGESWCERTDPDDPPAYNFALHGRDLYNEVLHVPAVIWNPSLDSDTISQQVQNIDVLPTILEILDKVDNISINDNYSFDGQSILSRYDRQYALSSTNKPETGRLNKISVRDGSWKCIWTLDADNYELYNLSSAPEEQKDLSSSHPEQREQLDNILKETKKEYKSMVDDNEQLDEKTRSQLEDLGYI